MKIELKNIKHSEWASEETDCYQASLYVNGRKIGIVGNDGHGGCDYFHAGSRDCMETHAQADAWCRANLPKWSLELQDEHGNDEMMETDLEMLCSKLLNEHLRQADLRKLLRKAVVIKPHNADEIRSITWTKTPKIDARHVRSVRERGEPITILNDLPFEEALALFTKYA